MYVGLGLYAVGFLLYAAATQSWMMYAFTIVYCTGSIAGPALQGIMSSVVPANEQGELQGGFTSLMSLTSIIGPLVMSELFSYFTRSTTPYYFPGAALVLGAILTLMSAIFARKTLKKTMQ